MNKKIILLFILLIVFQGFLGFLFPSHGQDSYWQTVEELGLDGRYSFDSFDNSILGKVYPLIENYHLNLDAAGYMLVAHDFPQHYLDGNLTLLTRPLYPILLNIVSRPLHLISDSYSMTFVAGLIVNFILLFFTVYLFYWLLRKLISHRVALLSSVLLIFSPLTHVYLVQPETNMLGIFIIVFSLYLLYKYFKSPSLKKLVIFSLLLGILMLGKKILAIGIFFLALSFIFKRWKEGILFFILHLVPLFLWSVFANCAWDLPFYVDEVSHFGVGVWIFNIFTWPWYQSLQVFIESVPNFLDSVLSSFLILPVFLVPFGWKRLNLEKKNILVSWFVISFFLLLFAMQVYFIRYGFWLFPVIYPLAVLGIDEIAQFLGKYRSWLSGVFYVFSYGLIIILSSLDIYKFIPNFG